MVTASKIGAAVTIPSMGIVALSSAAVAAVIIVVYLLKRPALDLKVKLWLLLGLGVFPALAAATSTAAGMQRTTERQFCGSCHVMGAHFGDASTPGSQSLAARHSRNPYFGGQSCYTCHANYGMYGYVLTKQAGLRHVYEYYLGGYGEMTLSEAVDAIHLREPYDNTNCRQCHTTTLKDWRRVPEHESLRVELDANRVSCASAGCHGYAHPFSKNDAAPRSEAQGAAFPSASTVVPTPEPSAEGPSP
jgi:nitrate/TMAO reductase-like tetraheme cytochrome c subunit